MYMSRFILVEMEVLNNGATERGYEESFRRKYEVWRGGKVESAEKELEKFREVVVECTNDVCFIKRVG